MHGGQTLYYLDCYCGLSASRHAGTRVVTVSVDRMDFMSPVYPGEIMIFKTCVNRVHRSSLEVGARIEAEHPRSLEVWHMGTAYFSFVALNENGQPTPVPPLIAETEEDKCRMADAARRAYLRRLERDQAKGKAFSFTLDLLPERFLLCRADAGHQFPPLPGAVFAFASGDSSEATFVLPETADTDAAFQAICSAKGARVEKGWRVFAIREKLDISVSGVVGVLTSILAAEKIVVIVVQYISTFSSGYLVVRGDAVEQAAEALVHAGHVVNIA
jgi:acyl-CoA hydrolase